MTDARKIKLASEIEIPKLHVCLQFTCIPSLCSYFFYNMSSTKEIQKLASCGPLLGVKKRTEGQVLLQAARLISSVHCQPPCKTLKSVMLTSCNAMTLYRHRRWGVGRKQRLRQSRREWKEMLTKKKIQIYTAKTSNTSFLLTFFSHPLTILKSFPVNTSIFCSWKPP